MKYFLLVLIIFIFFLDFSDGKKNIISKQLYLNKINENLKGKINYINFLKNKCIEKEKKKLYKFLFIKMNSNFIKNFHTFKLNVRGSTDIKPKTNKSIAKRFKITKNGKLIRKKAGRNHMLRKKTSSNKSSLRKRTTIASNRIAKKYKSVIFK
ncbi:apicoplast ribosomal protein L35 precursor, putative [Plasmodium gallinaceum]|uniref:50S ribosomal protein L35 n=1 Tax=Plasmodium gallinaceum TaxID=5849 RepID=A0A1J1GZ97_PLAGA|nr:apicoplast ribosomal protein L35 precursor, putative [Plasmodium gallinaceum]CRG96625.1 apicoplast ribosomal protein L35 precursor, putative [Plasmodium gallinaceum]